MSQFGQIGRFLCLLLIGTTAGAIPGCITIYIVKTLDLPTPIWGLYIKMALLVIIGIWASFGYLEGFLPKVSSQKKHDAPIILDTSAIIDGRVVDVAETGVFSGALIIPDFVLDELQNVADASDHLKRSRGRRGLDMLKRLERSQKVEIKIVKSHLQGKEDVDQKLLIMAEANQGKLLSTDFNLEQVAGIRGIPVINLNNLANALKTVVLPGENLRIKILRAGEEAGQGIGYLDDGTMVVVDQAKTRINETVNVNVTSNLQTSAGRMIFAKIKS